jgi:hypothetical protein
MYKNEIHTANHSDKSTIQTTKEDGTPSFNNMFPAGSAIIIISLRLEESGQALTAGNSGSTLWV